MKATVILAALLAAAFIQWHPANARSQELKLQAVTACGTPNNTPVVGQFYFGTMDQLARACMAGNLTVSGSTSNASSGVVTSSTNVPTVGYAYWFNGTTWDQALDDSSKRLLVGSSSGGFQVGSFADGAIATMGTQADAAWSGSGNATEIALGKYMANAVPTKGQTTMSSSVPVTMASDQVYATTNAATAFQQTCTASAVQMASHALTNGLVIKALPANTGTAYIGPSGVTTGTGYPLKAGEAISYGVANSNQLYLICSDTSSIIAATGN